MVEQNVPKAVYDAIVEWSEEISCGDKKEAREIIKQEIGAYQSLQILTADMSDGQRSKLIELASEWNFTWKERLDAVVCELDARRELDDFSSQDLPAGFINRVKAEAILKYPDSSVQQLEHLNQMVQRHFYVNNVRSRLASKKELLIKLEHMIGAECYNGNIQNYSAGGVWVGEGRSIRYPVTFMDDGVDDKRRHVPADIKEEKLITGRYRFGANELNIFRALANIVEMLERDYGLRL